MIRMFSSAAAGRRYSAKGRNIAEIAHRIGRICLELIENSFGGHSAGDRRIPRGNALCHGDDIRLYAVMLIAKPFTGPANAAHHFVKDQKDTVFGKIPAPVPSSLSAVLMPSSGDGLKIEATDRVRPSCRMTSSIASAARSP